MKINLEIDLATLGFDQDPDTGEYVPTSDLMGRVVELIASQFVNRYKVEEIVINSIRDACQEQIGALVAEVLSGPIKRTDYYGNPKEKETTVRLMVMAAVDDWMKLPGRDSYNAPATMGDSLKKIVDEIMRKQLEPTITEAKKRISEEVLRLAVDGAAKAIASARVI
jgi:hypothetical protein